MGSKTKEISARYEDIMTKKSKLDLRENVDRKSYGTRGRLPPTSLVNEAHVYGREDDKEEWFLDLYNEETSYQERVGQVEYHETSQSDQAASL
ncbi:hypothetical protein CFP56_022025 [Quercus suber]|uniref:Uncharacterized protein n=1 Tax=Quercus suber TaxID=58331 RepID=A0AAW0KDZ4_QUESU